MSNAHDQDENQSMASGTSGSPVSQSNIRALQATASPAPSAVLRRVENWRGGVPRTPRDSRERSLRGSSEGVGSSASGSFWIGSRTMSGLSSSSLRKEKGSRNRAINTRLRDADLIASLPGLTYLHKEQEYRKLDKEIVRAPPDPVFMEYWESHPLQPAPVDLSEWCFVEANTVVELNHLRKFGREFKPLAPKFKDTVMMAADYVSHLLRLPERLPWPEKSGLGEVKYRQDKFPGIEYARMGMKTRGEAQELALLHAQDAYDRLMAGERVKPQVNRMGGRGKFVRKEKLEQSGEKPTAGRLIFMGGQRDVLLNGLLEQPLTRAYKSPRYPISLGKTWWHGGTDEFVTRFSRFSKFSCFDAASFDSSLPPWLIQLAVNILREQYEDGMNSKYDAYWDFVFEGLAHSEVMLDNGLVFGRGGGSTSGHNFNTLMQSVATLIISYTCHLLALAEIDPERVFSLIWVESLGDDQHLGAEDEAADLTVEHLGPIAEEVFGVDWMGDKSFDTELLVDQEVGAFQSSQYLGKYFRELDENVQGVDVAGVVPYRPTAETLLRLAFPERGVLSLDGAWERAIGHYADGAGNNDTRKFLEGYMDWLEEKGAGRDFEWSDKWSRRFTGGFDSDVVPVPTCRISYLDWLRLVLV